MKVILFNGSPRKEGCTFTALSEVAGAIESCGIETQIIQVTDENFSKQAEAVKEAVEEADGIIVGSPVYYSSPTGNIIAFLDKLFGICGKSLAYKPAAAVTSCRRGGATATLDVINKYFTINNMPVVSSNYWNMVHGNTPDEVRKDEEGMQTMRELGKNMAWLIRCIEAGKRVGIDKPIAEDKVRTSYIR